MNVPYYLLAVVLATISGAETWAVTESVAAGVAVFAGLGSILVGNLVKE